MGHPRVYGADHFPQKFHNFAIGSSPCIRGGFFKDIFFFSDFRFIPVYTGRILNSSKISAAEESSIPSQILMAEPVCIIFLRYIFADNAFWSILVRNDTYFGNCSAANSPPYIRSRSLRTEAGDIMVGFIPVYMGLECINTYYKTIREWLIPVYTGQILLNANIVGLLKVHPRVYGANDATSPAILKLSGSSPCVRGKY